MRIHFLLLVRGKWGLPKQTCSDIFRGEGSLATKDRLAEKEKFMGGKRQ